MDNNLKVLVASPLFDGMKYCIKEFLNSMRALSYDNYSILLVDNSRQEDFFNELKKETGVKVIKDDTNETVSKRRLISSRNKILQYAINENFDYVLMMDTDVIPPKNIISELLNCKKDIVTGLYFNNFQSSGKIKLLPVAWAFITPREFEEITRDLNFGPLVKSNLDLRRHLTSKEAESGELFKVKYGSAGCMLLSKKVFEKVRYGLLDVTVSTSDDIYFFEKAREAGFEIYCYTKIKCEHLIEGKYKKDSDGNLIHPLFK
ncbi:MAG: glycosyltransferase [Nanoarchaeota archaeon]|nr:glycosyltransferase [Nanoarchaeota archaeon]MBU1103625.1 glycosyltransferase [Nanoarchaeota archaeon]